MIGAASKAARDIFSRPFRAVLWKSLGLTVLLFAFLLFGAQVALSYLDLASWAWLGPIIAIVAGLGLLVAFIVLAPPVTAIFAGLFLDHVAAMVERTHYPEDSAGRSLPAILSLVTAMRFALVVLAVNLVALPFLLIGIGAVAMLIANAYILSREYFELISRRHLSRQQTDALRQRHFREIFVAGFLPAVLMFLPFANIFVPIFSTSYFTHFFKTIVRAQDWASFVDRDKGRG
jgi:CysZ protein